MTTEPAGPVRSTADALHDELRIGSDPLPAVSASMPPSAGDAIEDCALSTRTTNVLRRLGVVTVGDVCRHRADELLTIPNFGATSLAELRSALSQRGLAFNGSSSGAPDSLRAVEGRRYVPDLTSGADLTGSQDLSLDDCELARRTINALHTVGMRTVGDVCARGPEELLAIPNFGAQSLDDLESQLRRRGFALASPQGAEIRAAWQPTDQRAQRPPCPVDARDPLVERNRLIVAAVDNGATYETVARQHSMSRERVRQILKEHGKGSGSTIRANRRRAEAREHQAEIVRTYRRGKSAAEIASEMGLSATLVSELIRETVTKHDRAVRRGNRQNTAEKVYTDEELIEAVAEVGRRVGRTPTTGEYDSIAVSSGLPRIATIHNRLGWREAVTAAGLETRPAYRQYTQRWSEAAVWRALRQLVIDLGEVPTLNRYDEMAQLDDGLPSAATVRNRVGGWITVTANLASMPRPGDLLERLAITRPVASTQEGQESIWMAYLADDLDDLDLLVLLIAELFVWDESYGSSPPLLHELLSEQTT